MVVLQIEQTQALFALEQGHMGELTLVQIQTFGVGGALRGLTVHDEHAWDLWQFSEDDLVVVLDAAHDSVLEQVAVALILLSGGVDGGLVLGTWLLDRA